MMWAIQWHRDKKKVSSLFSYICNGPLLKSWGNPRRKPRLLFCCGSAFPVDTLSDTRLFSCISFLEAFLAKPKDQKCYICFLSWCYRRKHKTVHNVSVQNSLPMKRIKKKDRVMWGPFKRQRMSIYKQLGPVIVTWLLILYMRCRNTKPFRMKCVVMSRMQPELILWHFEWIYFILHILYLLQLWRALQQTWKEVFFLYKEKETLVLCTVCMNALAPIFIHSFIFILVIWTNTS